MRRLGVLTVMAAAAWAAALTAFPARAGLFDDNQARNQVEQLRSDMGQEVKKLQSSIDTATNAQLNLAGQIQQLQMQIDKLRGQIEVENHEIQVGKKRQTDFYTDLDKRLRKLEAAAKAAKPAEAAGNAPGTASANAPGNAPAKAPPKPATAAPTPAVATVAPPAANPGLSETGEYEAALNLLKAKKYPQARDAFEKFIKDHGKGTLAPNAHYWAATADYQMHNYGSAAEMFAKVVAGWPKSAKAPDALLGKANSQLVVGDEKAARKTLDTLIRQYPDSSAARIARQRFKNR